MVENPVFPWSNGLEGWMSSFWYGLGDGIMIVGWPWLYYIALYFLQLLCLSIILFCGFDPISATQNHNLSDLVSHKIA